MFRVETPRELANWSRNLVQGAHDAASLIKEINCGKLKLVFLSKNIPWLRILERKLSASSPKPLKPSFEFF